MRILSPSVSCCRFASGALALRWRDDIMIIITMKSINLAGRASRAADAVTMPNRARNIKDLSGSLAWSDETLGGYVACFY
jgi:hypothetical protein